MSYAKTQEYPPRRLRRRPGKSPRHSSSDNANPHATFKKRRRRKPIAGLKGKIKAYKKSGGRSPHPIRGQTRASTGVQKSNAKRKSPRKHPHTPTRRPYKARTF